MMINCSICCVICGKEFKSPAGLSSHLKTVEKISQRDYFLNQLGNTKSLCIECGQEAKFINLSKGYSDFCSKACSARSFRTKERRKKTCIELFGCVSNLISDREKIKKTNLVKYGFENPAQSSQIKDKMIATNQQRYGGNSPLCNDLIKDKIKTTCLRRYGVSNPMQNIEVQDQAKRTNLKNYGVECVFQSDVIKSKSKRTIQSKYGVDDINQCEEIRQKSKQTNLDRLGCEYPMQSEKVRQKSVKTCIERYGVENYAQTNEFKEKFQLTMLSTYGVINPMHLPEIVKKVATTCIEKYGVANYAQTDEFKECIREFYRNMMIDRILKSNRLGNTISPNFDVNNFKGCGYVHQWVCNVCGSVFEDILKDGRIPRCLECYPLIVMGVSKTEKEIAEFVKSLGIEIIENDRLILNGKELDIYIPSHNLAIEFDGLYWHSELSRGIEKNYHLDKTFECQKRGIQLIHIFEDEWIEKKEIIKSIIKAKLGLCDRIYARKCIVKDVPVDIAYEFLEDNHIQGFVSGKHYIGLYLKESLVSILSLGVSRYDKSVDYEILRFCTKLGCSVVGGFSKLFKNAISIFKLKSCVTYSDLRYGEGLVYAYANFDFIRRSSPSYYYLDSYLHRYSRLGFQKHLLESKLETFDPNLTEWENMQLNGYDRIWDCGCNVYVWRK